MTNGRFTARSLLIKSSVADAVLPEPIGRLTGSRHVAGQVNPFSLFATLAARRAWFFDSELPVLFKCCESEHGFPDVEALIGNM